VADAFLLAGKPPSGLLAALAIRPRLGFRQRHRRGGGTVSAGPYCRVRDDGRLTRVSSIDKTADVPTCRLRARSRPCHKFTGWRDGAVSGTRGASPLSGTAARRGRTLAHLSPIFDLHLNRSRNPSEVAWSAYDFIALTQQSVQLHWSRTSPINTVWLGPCSRAIPSKADSKRSLTRPRRTMRQQFEPMVSSCASPHHRRPPPRGRGGRHVPWPG
jgi:hypothetical protein